MDELSEIEVIRPDWPAPANVRAFTTTRNGGFSHGPWGSLNLGKNCGDKPRHVQQNRSAFSRLLPSEVRWLNQVHGTDVVSWDKAQGPGIEADAIVSNHPGQVCAVLTADCLPVLFCDRTGTHIAAAHVGWRGLAAGIQQNTVLAMDCKPAEVMACLGPAIGPRAFEVGQDVDDAFVKQNPESTTAFKSQGDRWIADLSQLARQALSRVGVRRVFGGVDCTYSDPERFFSYRRDGITGRMVSLAWLDK